MTYRRPFSVFAVSLVATLAFFALFTGTLEPFDFLAWGESMEPHLAEGDIYVPVEPGVPWFVGEGATEHGIVTERTGRETGYKSFGYHGDVVVFPSKEDEVWIHRAVDYVEEGEVWEGIEGAYIAERDGYITGGDNNTVYDQEPPIGIQPVPPDEIQSKAVEPVGDPNVRRVLNTSVCRSLNCGDYPPPSEYLRNLTDG